MVKTISGFVDMTQEAAEEMKNLTPLFSSFRYRCPLLTPVLSQRVSDPRRLRGEGRWEADSVLPTEIKERH